MDRVQVPNQMFHFFRERVIGYSGASERRIPSEFRNDFSVQEVHEWRLFEKSLIRVLRVRPMAGFRIDDGDMGGVLVNTELVGRVLL